MGNFKQIYTPYYDWECFKNGMWNKCLDDEKNLNKAIKFTSNHIVYGEAMSEVINLWENSMLNFLTNKSINRKAYLGHCAVCYKLNIPEHITRKAWKYLTEDQKLKANLEASKNILKWEQNQKLLNMLKYGKKDVIQKEYQMKLNLV